MGETILLPTTPLPFSRDTGDILFVHFINTTIGDCIFLEVPEKLKSQSGVISGNENENKTSNYTNILIDIGIGAKVALDHFLKKINVRGIHYASGNRTITRMMDFRK